MIVNADDFGRDARVNAAIAAAFAQGLVSSTTLMPNQGGFDEAVELAQQLRLERHVGVHLVLTDGVPLTDEIRRLSRFCDDEGRFRNWRASAHAFRLSDVERRCVVQELRSQVTRVRLAGLPVTHVDSHHHVHTEWAIGACVLEVARTLGVPFVRIARNCGTGIGPANALYKRRYNARLRKAERAGTRWFGDVADWVVLAASPKASGLDDAEVMTHPTLDGAGVVVEVDGGPLREHLAPLAGRLPASSFAGARYRG